jgi:alkylation response protein AidB-like acyl-CoA dehydrogenase
VSADGAAAAVVAAARAVADEVLFPDAMRVDTLDAVPAAHFDALAAEGLYGASVPARDGGLGLDLPVLCRVVEELAGGCLATTFVWLQHRGLSMTLAAPGTPAPLREAWLGPVCQGKIRGAVALQGIIPGPPQIRARPDGDGWRLDGTAAWATGWGLVDLLLVLARGPGETLVSLILDATDQPGLTVTRQHLSAVNASATVRLDFDGLRVPADRVAGQEPYEPAANLRPDRLRINGSLALGLAGRCTRLLGPGPLDTELAACRARLDHADGAEEMQDARAAAAELAVRATAALAVRDGSGSIMTSSHPQRLAREAVFLLVFGSRPGIKSALLRRLGA